MSKYNVIVKGTVLSVKINGKLRHGRDIIARAKDFAEAEKKKKTLEKKHGNVFSIEAIKAKK